MKRGKTSNKTDYSMIGNKIVETLELMCDKKNPQDKKILLLAELVETRCESLSRNQSELQKSLDTTLTKLDRLTELLERYESDTHGCPVYKNKDDYEKLSFYIKNPKATAFIILGVIAIVGGSFGSVILDLINNILK